MPNCSPNVELLFSWLYKVATQSSCVKAATVNMSHRRQPPKAQECELAEPAASGWLIGS